MLVQLSVSGLYGTEPFDFEGMYMYSLLSIDTALSCLSPLVLTHKPFMCENSIGCADEGFRAAKAIRQWRV